MFNRSLAVLLLVAATASAQRLPSNAHPEHYALHLTPDLKAATFTGDETIDVVLAAPSKTITLNALEVTISSVTSGSQTAQVSFDEDKQQATFTFPEALPAGKSTLAIKYAGILNDKLRGFYLSKTKDVADKDGTVKFKGRNYAVTQFESTDARRAFPSFDEPAQKATFDISLTVDKGDVVISNTNQIKDKKEKAIEGQTGGDKHTVSFATTPKMSTYLVAFLVGDFKCSKGSSDGTPIRVCATPDKVKLTKFALKEAEHTLHYYNDYFGIRYPMPKLDMVAIPDFEAGAMENFGCITYRETGLLVDEKNGSVDAKKNVEVDVTHEMAHQWFGDMVTMQWWDNIWLNEGFATWMEGKAAEHLHPEWEFTQDGAATLNAVMGSDSRATTRAIRATADTPAQINEMFDGITYEKGGAVIGMVENFLGEEVFRQGVHNYLTAHLYANATAEDFWNAQTATSHQPVDKIMSSFIDQPGVPLVKVDAHGSSLAVDQSRFFNSPQAPTGAAPQSWTLPLCFKTAAAPHCSLITPETHDVDVPTDAASPLYVNAATKGYFRTEYTPQETAAITAEAETKLSVEERIGYVGDRWALMEAGHGSVGDYLDLALALKNDPNANVLETALGNVQAIDRRIATPQDSERLHALIRKQFEPIYAAAGGPMKKEPEDRMERRSLLFSFLGAADDPAVEKQAETITMQLFSGKDTSDPALNDASVALTAKYGNAAFYDAMKAISQKSTNPSLQQETLFLLANFQDPALVKRTLDYAVSGEVRNQDSYELIIGLLVHSRTQAQAWDYVRNNWDKVHAQLTTSSGQRLVGATGSFCTVAERDEAQSFFATHKVDNAERTLKQVYDASTDCIRLRAAEEPKLKLWLDAQSAQ
ncbi:MAG TPA: M1 family metallopeptidase [Acidobacteriaceae bacterium]